jgi:deoxyribose-phosphate aldolase
MNLANYIDHTLLKPTATISEIRGLCGEAITYGFYAICVNGCHVAFAKKCLIGSPVKIVSVVGFPLGATSTKSKVLEAKDSIGNGADEIDLVLNVGWLKSGKRDLVGEEIRAVKKAIHKNILKVIIETCYLAIEEKKMACKLVIEAKADFIKTSTGFGSGGANFEDVILIKKLAGEKIKIKASGGIKDRETAERYIALGVSRIGTSSGVSMINS